MTGQTVSTISCHWAEHSQFSQALYLFKSDCWTWCSRHFTHHHHHHHHHYTSGMFLYPEGSWLMHDAIPWIVKFRNNINVKGEELQDKLKVRQFLSRNADSHFQSQIIYQVHTNPKLYENGIWLPVSHEKESDIRRLDIWRRQRGCWRHKQSPGSRKCVAGRAALVVSPCLSSNYVSLPTHSATATRRESSTLTSPQILLHFLLNTTDRRKTNKTFLSPEE